MKVELQKKLDAQVRFMMENKKLQKLDLLAKEEGVTRSVLLRAFVDAGMKALLK